MTYKRCEKPTPDTSIDISVFGDPCAIYQNMLNRIDALRRLRDQWPRCDISRFDVQFQLSDAMTYMFAITDNANGERYEWSVVKEFTKESPQRAFERDYNESALRYNSGVRRAIDDYLEGLHEQEPDAFYQYNETASGYRVWRPIIGGLGLVPFELSFTGKTGPVIQDRALHPEIWEYIGNIPGESGRSVARMVKRLIKLGVSFDKVSREVIKDYRKISLTGHAYRTGDTHTEVKLVLQEIAMTDTDLLAYHQYFTE